MPTRSTTCSRAAGPRAALRSSATCRRASRRTTWRSRRWSRWSRPASTPSRSACPTPTRSWRARSSRPPTRPRWTPAPARPTCCAPSRRSPPPARRRWSWATGTRSTATASAAGRRRSRTPGASGAITPDLIPEEAPEWLEACRDLDLDPVFLVAPSSTDERIAVVGRTNRGFVYAAAVMGVTGARAEIGAGARTLVERVTRADRPARRRRPRRQHRRAGRAGRRLRRRRGRRLGPRERACSPAASTACGGSPAELAEGVRSPVPA